MREIQTPQPEPRHRTQTHRQRQLAPSCEEGNASHARGLEEREDKGTGIEADPPRDCGDNKRGRDAANLSQTSEVGDETALEAGFSHVHVEQSSRSHHSEVQESIGQHKEL
eukprot:413176-Hanusia_phi.AAC.1